MEFQKVPWHLNLISEYSLMLDSELYSNLNARERLGFLKGHQV